MSVDTKKEAGVKIEMKSVNINIPKDLYRALKFRVIDEETSLRDLCWRVFKEGLESYDGGSLVGP